MRPLYVMLVGLPGSGKTTLANKIVDDYPDGNWVVLSTDNYIEREADRLGLSYNAAFADAINIATAEMNVNREIALSARRNIIHDQTNLTIKSRARKLGDIPSDYVMIGLFCSVCDDERRQRLALRPEKVIPAEVDEKMAASLECPTTGEFDVVAVAYLFKWAIGPHFG